MSDFRDPELERLFGRTSGPAPDVNVAFERVKGRVRKAKRRRAAVVGGAACTLLLALGVLVAGRNDPAGSIQPGSEVTGPDDSRLMPDDTTAGTIDEPAPEPTSSTNGSTDDDASGPSITTSPSPSAPATTTPNNSTAPGTTVAGGGATPPQPTVPVTPTTATVPAASAPATPPSTPASSAPGTTSAPVTQTFGGVGGSVTVRMQDGTLTLLGYQAADGFVAEVKQSSGDRVEVRFESDTHRTDARVDLSDGSMVDNFDESER